jgi:hypothetical protein
MPANVWIRTIEDGHRLRLNREIVSAVAWLAAGKPRTGFACIGKEGQLELLADRPGAAADALLEQQSGLSSSGASIPENWHQYARFSASVWPVRFLGEPGRKRLSFIVPREARTLGVVPPAGGIVALYVHGEVFEVWDGERWVAHIRQARGAIGNLTEDIVDELSDLPRPEISSRIKRLRHGHHER